MPADGETVGRVGSRVDDPEPDPPVWQAGDGDRFGGHAPIDQVGRVGDVAGVSAQRLVGRGHAHLHAVHAVHAHTVATESSQQLGRRRTPSVGPIIEDEHDILVVLPGLSRVGDDQGRVETGVELHADVRMEPVRPRVGDDEVVVERRARSGGTLGEIGYAVHVVA